MKWLMAALYSVVLIGCGGSSQIPKASEPERMELGWMQRENFMQSAYPKFLENYAAANIDQQSVDMIKLLHTDVDIIVVLGTWCSDSKREVPRFLKIIELAEIPSSRLKFYGVDRTKKSSDGLTEQYHIELVPTFIFLKQGDEVGRIVESPRTTLEADMLAILADAQNR